MCSIPRVQSAHHDHHQPNHLSSGRGTGYCLEVLCIHSKQMSEARPNLVKTLYLSPIVYACHLQSSPIIMSY
jgi:hypothetical protein